tara:strand:- start:194 stop:586 length:393 start_codon:yes stop_codon:yes gene_type:complete
VSKNLVQLIILAAVSDGKIDPEEKQLLQTYRRLYPPIRDITQDEFDNEKILLFNRLSAGMSTKQIIENIGEKLSEKERNIGYALAVEVCASNFEMLPQEVALLKDIVKEWDIKIDIVSALQVSAELRYYK